MRLGAQFKFDPDPPSGHMCDCRRVVVHSRLVSAQEVAPGSPSQTPLTWGTSVRTVELFPAGDVFPVYAADPHRPTNQLGEAFLQPGPDSRDRFASDAPLSRWAVRHAPRCVVLAGRTILANQPRCRTGRRIRFAIQERRHRLGWQLWPDGHDRIRRFPFAFKVALLHTSSHLGDEYEAREQDCHASTTPGRNVRLRPPGRPLNEQGATAKLAAPT